MKIDWKFRILAVNPCKVNRVYTEADGIFFCAKDAALPAAIVAYIDECKLLDCGDSHIQAMTQALERIRAYQKSNLKIPDTDTDCEIDRCVGGIGIEDTP